jgi:hypothetical protein
MPIEIKELHIRGEVSNENRTESDNHTATGANQREIINACVEKVLKILADKKER